MARRADTTSHPEHREAIRAAREHRSWVDRQRVAARDELARRCAIAREAGVPLAQIAKEAGLSRQAVYDLLRPSASHGERE